MLRRSISVAAGLAAGAAVYFGAPRLGPNVDGPSILAVSSAALVAIAVSWVWRKWVAAGQVMADAAALVAANGDDETLVATAGAVQVTL